MGESKAGDVEAQSIGNAGRIVTREAAMEFGDQPRTQDGRGRYGGVRAREVACRVRLTLYPRGSMLDVVAQMRDNVPKSFQRALRLWSSFETTWCSLFPLPPTVE